MRNARALAPGLLDLSRGDVAYANRCRSVAEERDVEATGRKAAARYFFGVNRKSLPSSVSK
jgi:hypothetical protein